MIRTTLITTLLVFPLLMLQAADQPSQDPNKLVAYYEFEATLLTSVHYTTPEDVQRLADLNAGKPQSFPVDEVSVKLYSASLPSPKESRLDSLNLFIQHCPTVSLEYDFISMYRNAQNAAERAKVLGNTVWFATRFLHVRALQKANPVAIQKSEVEKYLQDVTPQSFDSVSIKMNERRIMAGLLVNEPGTAMTTLARLLLEATNDQ